MDIHELGVEFWDLVVLTARNETQKKAYQAQINNKLRWGELPLGVNYLVFCDPPGPKIGKYLLLGGLKFQIGFSPGMNLIHG